MRSVPNTRLDFLKSKGPPTAGLILAGAAGLGAASLLVPTSLLVVRALREQVN